MKKVQLSNDSNGSFSELPYEVMWDILCRLPIKTCISCKLVCKDWYNIIKTPSFAIKRRSHTNCVTLLLKCRFLTGRYYFVLLELDKGANNIDHGGDIRVGTDCMIKFKSKFGVPNGALYIVNMCNGLVCLTTEKKWACYYICNFLTSRFVRVEQEPRARARACDRYVLGSCPMPDNDAQCLSHLSKVGGISDMGSLILGSRMANFEGSSPLMTLQYKILRILRTQGHETVAEILTLGSNSWRQIDGAPKCKYNFQVFLNGSIHWYDSKSDKGRLWAFHFETEKFFHIPIPEEFKGRNHAELTVFDSCLCFCYILGGYSTVSGVWLMKEYGVGHSWVRQFVIPLPEKTWFQPYRPLVRMDNGQILVQRFGSHLALYDPETRRCKQVKIDGDFEIESPAACDEDFSWI